MTSPAPTYIIIFETTEDFPFKDEPHRIELPDGVREEIEQHFRYLAADAEPDLDKFHLPEGIKLRIEKLQPGDGTAMVVDPKPPYRDRNREYVPEGMFLPPRSLAEVGAYPEHRRLIPVTSGKADELNRDWHGRWDWADVSDGGDGSHWSHFEGHREQVDIEVHTHNYRETNDWKGRDEIRAVTLWTVSLDRIQVGEGRNRDPFQAMLDAREYARKMSCAESWPISSWREADDLIGRRVYYQGQPATIHRLVLDQGCIMVAAATENGRFRPQPYQLDDDTDICLDDDVDSDNIERVKIEILSGSIWWYRDRLTPAEQAIQQETVNS